MRSECREPHRSGRSAQLNLRRLRGHRLHVAERWVHGLAGHIGQPDLVVGDPDVGVSRKASPNSRHRTAQITGAASGGAYSARGSPRTPAIPPRACPKSRLPHDDAGAFGPDHEAWTGVPCAGRAAGVTCAWIQKEHLMQRAMSGARSLSVAGKLTVAGLVVAAAGIVIQIVSGAEYPTVPPGPDHPASRRGRGRPGQPLAVDSPGGCDRLPVSARWWRARGPGEGSAGRSDSGRRLCRHRDPTAGAGYRAHRRRGRRQAELPNPTSSPWLTHSLVVGGLSGFRQCLESTGQVRRRW